MAEDVFFKKTAFQRRPWKQFYFLSPFRQQWALSLCSFTHVAILKPILKEETQLSEMFQFSEPSGITPCLEFLLDFRPPGKTYTHQFWPFAGEGWSPSSGPYPIGTQSPALRQTAIITCLLPHPPQSHSLNGRLTSNKLLPHGDWGADIAEHTPLTPGEMWEPCIPIPLSGPILPDKEPRISYPVLHFCLPTSSLSSPKVFQDKGGHVG